MSGAVLASRKSVTPLPESLWPDDTNTGPDAAGYTSRSLWTGSYLISGSNQVITGRQFTGIGPQVTGNNVTFRGCEFKETYVDGFLMRLDGINCTFEDCRWRPGDTASPPVITRAQSYQQGIKMINGVGLTVKRCDFWGFGNAIEFEPSSSTQTNPIIIQDSWFHHAADQAGSTYHHDGILSSYAASYITVDHNSIVSGGNTNAIAFQTPAGLGNWSDLTITNNLLGGFGYTVNLGDDRPSNNVTFTGNTFTTEIEPIYGPFKNNWAAFTGTRVWSGNRWKVPAGAAYGNPAWNDLYWWPTDGKNTGGHIGDYTGDGITHGRQVNATNTGIAGIGVSSGSLITTGSTTYSTAGQTITGRRFTGPVTLAGNNITLSGCQVETSGSTARAITITGTGCIVQDTTILPPSSSMQICLYIPGGNNAVIRRVDARGAENIVTLEADDVVIEDSYLHDVSNAANPAGHRDVIEVYAGARARIRRNRMVMDDDETAVINIAPWWGSVSVSDCWVDDNYIDGGNMHFVVDVQSTGTITNTKVRRNDMGGHTNTFTGRYTALNNADGRARTNDDAAQASNTGSIMWPTTGADVNRWVDCSDLSPDRTGQIIIP
jgi:hypothetical protein